MRKKKICSIIGLVLVAALTLQLGAQNKETPTIVIKTTKKPNVIKLGAFEREEGLVTQLYQVTPRQASALKSFLSKWLTDKGQVEEYEDLRILQVTDTPTSIKRIDELLETIDKPEPQIMIEARITELTIDSGIELGVEIPYGASPPGIRASTTAMSSAFDPPDYLKSIVMGAKPTTTFEGGAAVFSRKDHLVRLDAVLRALQTKGLANIISEPKVLTINGQEAVMSAGQEFPYVSSMTTVGGTIQASTGYKEVGVKLSVIPFFIGEDTVELIITPEVSVVTGWQTIQPGVSVPIIAKRSISTKVNIKSGETLALGGLLKEETLSTTKKVPILGHIPILGWFFSYKKETKSKTNLVFFITPRVITEARQTLPKEEVEEESEK